MTSIIAKRLIQVKRYFYQYLFDMLRIIHKFTLLILLIYVSMFNNCINNNFRGYINVMKKIILAGSLAAAFVFSVPALAACNSSGVVESVGGESAFSSFPNADMTGYEGLENYTRELKFKDVTVKDVDKAMKAGKSFVLYCGYRDCPWCNKIISILNDSAIEYGTDIAYINTRKDPSWSSNTDLADYDVFVSYFGDYLDTDSDGKKHLYVPHIFFVKDGVVVDEHPGTVSGHENASDELTSEQKEKLSALLGEGFKSVTGL